MPYEEMDRNPRSAASARTGWPTWLVLVTTVCGAIAGYTFATLGETKTAPVIQAAPAPAASPPENYVPIEELTKVRLELSETLDQVTAADDRALDAKATLDKLRGDCIAALAEAKRQGAQEQAAKDLREALPRGSSKPRSSAAEPKDYGRVTMLSGPGVSRQQDVTVVYGKLYSTRSSMMTVGVDVELIADGEVIESTTIEVDVAPGETAPWEVEFGPAQGSLRAAAHVDE